MNQKLAIIIIVVAVIIVGSLIYVLGLGNTNSSSEGTVSITDMAGRTVQIPDKVNKVIGTGCSGREIVYLDAAEKMVGIEQIESNSTGGWGDQLPYMIVHPELFKLPIIGNARTGTVNYEKIVEVKPDVIFTANAQQAEDIQSKTGITTVVVYVGAVGTAEQMDDYKKSLKLMGDILGRENRAEELINYINSCEEDLANRSKNADKKETVYIAGQAFKGTHSITSTNPYYPSLRMLNANNVVKDINNVNATINAVQIDKEQLIKWDPDIIFVEGGSIPMIKEEMSKNPDYQNINAIKQRKIYGLLPYCLYSYNKDNMLANAYYIGKIIYPEQFKDINPEEKANEIFTEFYGNSGAQVYPALKEKYGGFNQLNL